MAKRAILAEGTVLVGVDFTSSPREKKPITVALGRWESAPAGPTYRLDTVRCLASLPAFDEFLRRGGPWIGGFDLPFGQPRSLVEHEGWPTDWPAFVDFFRRQSRQSLRETFRRWCDARPPGDKFAWRRTDKPAGSSPAMRWTNPPVAWMMHAGIGRMVDAGLVFPAHRFPSGRSPGPDAARIAFEAYPGFTARKVCRLSYKSDDAARRTADRTRNRRLILDALVAGTAGLGLSLAITPAWSRRLVADGGGDLLDAVICALQAGHAASLPDDGLPRRLDPLEGWIASVPDPEAGSA
ncbi:MAG: DUF429 domain-containing protein [Planctomycetia bacterium]|nr:DUF429 domain-containing protein [Planctomycetia bacterium]